MSESLKVSNTHKGFAVTAANSVLLLFRLMPSYAKGLCVWTDSAGFIGDVGRKELIAAMREAIKWLEEKHE